MKKTSNITYITYINSDKIPQEKQHALCNTEKDAYKYIKALVLEYMQEDIEECGVDIDEFMECFLDYEIMECIE